MYDAPRHLFVVHSTLAECVREVPFSNSGWGTAILIEFRRLSSDPRGSCLSLTSLSINHSRSSYHSYHSKLHNLGSLWNVTM
jgi:hypothetical protein